MSEGAPLPPLPPGAPGPLRRPSGWAAVCRFGGIGDNLMVSSVLPQLRAKYGRVEVITQAPQSGVFENNPHVDKLSIYERGDLPGDNDAWQAWFRLRAKEYDFFVNLSHSCETSLVFMRGQTQFWWPVEVRRKLCDRSYLEFVHDVCGLPYECDPRFFPTAEEKEQALRTRARYAAGRRVVGWCLTGTRLDKIYPYTALAIARLIRELDASVMMFGAPGKDLELARQVQAHVKRQNGDDAGLLLALSPDPENPTWPVRRNIAQLQACDLAIGPDTGPMWGVAREPLPKIMLLSHASPTNITRHWVNTATLHADPARVPCWPCHRLHDAPDTCVASADGQAAACVSDLSVETVLATARRLLDS